MNTTPTEHAEAVLLVQYLEELKSEGKVVLYSHVPQETFTKSWATKARNKQEGVRKGVPDYIIVTQAELIFIELKRTKGSVTSPEQKEWIQALNKAGVFAFIAKGFEDAKLQLDTCLIECL